MIRVIRICRKCGAKIFSDVPEGLLPQMRAEQCASAILPDAAVAGGDVRAPAGISDTGYSTLMIAHAASQQQNDSAAPPSCSESWAITNCWKKSVAAVRAWCFVRGRKSLNRTVALKSHQPWSVGEQSAPETLSP